MGWTEGIARRGAAALVVLAAAAPAVALSTSESTPGAPAAARAEIVAAPRRAASPVPVPVPVAEIPATGAAPAPASEPGAPPAPLELVTEPAVVPAPRPLAVAAAPRPGRTFADRHPAHAAATQDPADPATTRWALLIGINDHMGRVSDNIGSRQDAEDLRAHLLANGWRDDHILLITDRAATRAAIVDGLRWLAEKTDPSSTAVFHYSGHSKKWYGRDHDGDGEVTDEGLWPTDDRFIPDSELVRLLDPVDASTAWISFATCNAAGFADHGLARPGRVLTFSSGEQQKSYEHPSWDNSVWGFLMIDQAMRAGAGDADGDGRVSVEEAWTWARPQASRTTSRQRHGPQDAVIVDHLDGELHLGVRGATPPPPPPSPAADPAPEQRPAPERDAGPTPDDEREPERHGGYLCVLCDR